MKYEEGVLMRDQYEAEKATTKGIAERKTIKNYLNNEYLKDIADRKAAANAQVRTPKIKDLEILTNNLEGEGKTLRQECNRHSYEPYRPGQLEETIRPSVATWQHVRKSEP